MPDTSLNINSYIYELTQFPKNLQCSILQMMKQAANSSNWPRPWPGRNSCIWCQAPPSRHDTASRPCHRVRFTTPWPQWWIRRPQNVGERRTVSNPDVCRGRKVRYTGEVGRCTCRRGRSGRAGGTAADWRAHVRSREPPATPADCCHVGGWAQGSWLFQVFQRS